MAKDELTEALEVLLKHHSKESIKYDNIYNKIFVVIFYSIVILILSSILPYIFSYIGLKISVETVISIVLMIILGNVCLEVYRIHNEMRVLNISYILDKLKVKRTVRKK